MSQPRSSVVPPYLRIIIADNTLHVRPGTGRYAGTLMGATIKSYYELRLKLESDFRLTLNLSPST